jgi:hypothetical protein
MLQDIISISRTALRSCGYAPQIMMLIERVTGHEFLKDHEITDPKPQNPIAPTITMDVPSMPMAPRTTRAGSAALPLGRSSSSSGSILRVLKNMFAWCCDTCQRQDVLLTSKEAQTRRWALMSSTSFPFRCLLLMMIILLLYPLPT